MTVTQARTGGETVPEAARTALDRAARHLLGQQHAQGWWQGELETNVTMDAEDLLLREFLGIRTQDETAAAARWIRSQQRADGTWANYYQGDPNLSTTVEAYVALRLAGDSPDASHLTRAAAWIRDEGGIPATRVFTRIWLALFGGWSAFFGGLDRGLHAYQRHGVRARPARAVRTAALRRCAEWIIARQERDGSWGGIQPPWVYSLMALHLLGYGLEHPVIRRGLAGLDRFTIWEDTADGRVRRLEACQSPVWDTVLAMIALSDAGLPADHPALASAARWVIDEEIRGPGDWQARRPGLSPGGWAFEFDNDGYPDIDDTAEVLLALRRVAPAAEPRSAAAVQRGIRWMTGMQSRDGGWGAFDADNTRKIVAKLPFCDFGEVIDPPSADVTAHVVEALAAEGLAGSKAVRRGVAWLLRAQEPDGSWFGRWGANYVYGTGAVLPALIAAGVKPGKPVIRRG